MSAIIRVFHTLTRRILSDRASIAVRKKRVSRHDRDFNLFYFARGKNVAHKRYENIYTAFYEAVIN